MYFGAYFKHCVYFLKLILRANQVLLLLPQISKTFMVLIKLFFISRNDK